VYKRQQFAFVFAKSDHCQGLSLDFIHVSI
jgi:hypothetical protein